MAADLDAEPLPRRKPVQPEPGARELLKAADLIRNAINPVALAGNGVVRAGGRARPARVRPRDRDRRRRDVHGQGRPWTTEDPRALGTVGLQSRDYAMAGFEDADVVIAIGYDLVEHAPKHWNPGATRRSS